MQFARHNGLALRLKPAAEVDRIVLAQINQDMQYIFHKKRQNYKIGTITCIGHSLGGALALLAGYDLAQEAIIPSEVKVRVCNFEAPKVGETWLAMQVELHPRL